MISMDIRLTVFNLIFRDAMLRELLMNYADRVDGATQGKTAAPTCFVALKWTRNDTWTGPAESQLLTVHVHMPRDRPTSEQVYLDVVVQRLRAALSMEGESKQLAVRHRGTSREATDNGGDTVFKVSTFEISPAAARRREHLLLALSPWTCFSDRRRIGSGCDFLSLN
ncbi:hypothetical protein [Pseudonocardia xinjiangensis]|uniref:Uncharacterized protein n=1 Tax=Pseudonocardia xinjiangensis TaxID=75289 RepID=A0ABX1RHH9_9PSEU|nr:hypothetical protein [Pseudonocardia xinjiangensis]NMH79281.1 hypothetical protein [Pseudonocardia xinjiangensis]